MLLDIERRTLLVAYAHVFPAERYPFPEAEVRAEWQSILTTGTARTVVAEAGTGAVGTVTVDPPYLQRLFVLPEWQGRGVGQVLHDWARRMLTAAGVGTAELLVLQANDRARQFYQRRGWHQVGHASASAYPPYPAVLIYRLTC